MWARTLLVLLFVPVCRPQYLEEEVAEDYKNADFYDNYEETDVTVPMLATTAMDSYTRVRRFGNIDDRRTLDPQELRDVKGALRDIFANRRIEAGAAADFTKSSTSSLFDITDKSTSDRETFKPFNQIDTSSYNQTDSVYDHSERPSTFSNGSDNTLDDSEIRSIKDILRLPTEDPMLFSSTYTPQEYEWKSTAQQEIPVYGKKEERSAIKEAVKGLNKRIQLWQPHDETNTILTTLLDLLDNSTERTLSPDEVKEVEVALERFISNQKQNTKSPLYIRNTTSVPHNVNSTQTTEMYLEELSTVTELWEMTTDEEYEYTVVDALRQLNKKKKRKRKRKKKPSTKSTIPAGMIVEGRYYTFPPGWPHLSRCPSTDTTPFKMNVQGMMWLLANLTYEYDMQLVERFSEGLIQYSVPTCLAVPTKAKPKKGILGDGSKEALATAVFDFDNTTVVAKCFVCGLNAPYIPHDSLCADAFAGDFLPLIPVDPTARGHIAKYRKYCRYLDIRDNVELPEHPRAVYGRFSGGCAVRWTDVSGVYTQRTCRNKRRAVTGNHFGSKRMAKLEMALNRVDNGCIISPMASLLPLSRGISLYARFHACVCTGAWCNRALRDVPLMVNIIISFWLSNILLRRE